MALKGEKLIICYNMEFVDKRDDSIGVEMILKILGIIDNTEDYLNKAQKTVESYLRNKNLNEYKFDLSNNSVNGESLIYRKNNDYKNFLYFELIPLEDNQNLDIKHYLFITHSKEKGQNEMRKA